jgi:hypothetical protein
MTAAELVALLREVGEDFNRRERELFIDLHTSDSRGERDTIAGQLTRTRLLGRRVWAAVEALGGESKGGHDA